MEERIYKSMHGTAAVNIVLGITTILGGIASEVVLIISGGKLLH